MKHYWLVFIKNSSLANQKFSPVLLFSVSDKNSKLFSSFFFFYNIYLYILEFLFTCNPLYSTSPRVFVFHMFSQTANEMSCILARRPFMCQGINLFLWNVFPIKHCRVFASDLLLVKKNVFIRSQASFLNFLLLKKFFKHFLGSSVYSWRSSPSFLLIYSASNDNKITL